MNAVSKEVRIGNKRGLHARASAKFVNLASQIVAEIEVEKDGNRVTGTSIMGLMMLGAAMGDTIVIHVDGFHAESVLAQLVAMAARAAEAITRAIVNLGHSFDIEIIAEGIESAEQQSYLLGLGCQTGQGYLYSKAVPAEMVQPMLRGDLARRA